MLNFKCVTVIFIFVPWTWCSTLVYLPGPQRQGNHLPGFQSAINHFLPYPSNSIKEFEYVPTARGYRYGYILNDGTVKSQNVVVKGTPYDMSYAGVDGINTGLNAVGIGGRPKNRKLSPKSLQSLAG